MPEMMPPRPAGSRGSKKCCADLVAAAWTTGAEAMPDDRVTRGAAAGRVRSGHRMLTQLAARHRFDKEACCNRSLVTPS